MLFRKLTTIAQSLTTGLSVLIRDSMATSFIWPDQRQYRRPLFSGPGFPVRIYKRDLHIGQIRGTRVCSVISVVAWF